MQQFNNQTKPSLGIEIRPLPHESMTGLGTTSLFKQTLSKMLVEKVRGHVKNKPRTYSQLANLLEPIEYWRHRHYCNLATLLDLSYSTVKRLFGSYHSLKKHHNFSMETAEKIKVFLQVDDLERAAMEYILKKGLGEKF